jgi:hypothetical protein
MSGVIGQRICAKVEVEDQNKLAEPQECLLVVE